MLIDIFSNSVLSICSISLSRGFAFIFMLRRSELRTNEALACVKHSLKLFWTGTETFSYCLISPERREKVLRSNNEPQPLMFISCTWRQNKNIPSIFYFEKFKSGESAQVESSGRNSSIKHLHEQIVELYYSSDDSLIYLHINPWSLIHKPVSSIRYEICP